MKSSSNRVVRSRPAPAVKQVEWVQSDNFYITASLTKESEHLWGDAYKIIRERLKDIERELNDKLGTPQGMYITLVYEGRGKKRVS